MKKQKSLFVIMMIIVITVFSGCSWFKEEAPPQGDPAEVVREGMNNLNDVETNSYKVFFKMDFNPPEDMEGELIFDATLEGVQDMSDSASPKFTMKIDGSGSLDDGDTESLKGELRLVDNYFYATLTSMSDFGGDLTDEDLEPYLEKWYKIPVPPATLNQFAVAGDEEDLTPEQKELKELIENTDLFKNIEYVNTENGNLHYKAELDTEALKTIVKEMAKIQGQALSSREIEEINEAFDAIEMPSELWIDESDIILTKFSGVLTMEPPEGGSITMDIVFSVGDFNKPVTVEAPADAEEFDPWSILAPLMLMGGGMEMMDEEMMFDDMDMFDEMDFSEMDFGEFEMEFDEAEWEEFMESMEEIEMEFGELEM